VVDKTLLWAFCLNLGVVFGAGLYEQRISVPRWVGRGAWHRDDALRDDVGRRFWGFTTTVPLSVLTLANLWAGAHAAGLLEQWWLLAAGLALAERVFTVAYFIPRMVGLMRSDDSPQARAGAQLWAALNWPRLGLTLLAWLAAMQAFALAHP
jgi:hypothetical protein